ncbi:GGDEF domain-containing protein [Marinobacter zhejiangensis]|uniref:diguanylate cyclase n=1 Tax=Marinobacter zhejiangensis TaxID=488535 RepID=A0A1I4M2I5_9GAMM|nr:GGDEF domain-containing protein [Marinobacter zhejiangensis]SFL97414.1 diguanylate cyclase (GGDEF) domain-containing protein [Marinobacter zhejiangensis]
MYYRLRNNFRLSIITLLGASAVLGITPFAVYRFWQGNLPAGFADTGILLSICMAVVYAWRTGDTDRAGFVLALVAVGGGATVATLLGEVGLFWLFPSLITSFFLTSALIAVLVNFGALGFLLAEGTAFSSQEQMWSFVTTAIVVSCCAYVFALRNDSQRERLEHLATLDPLTGVKNRRSMDQELAAAVLASQRNGVSYALVVLDLDHFKRINDEFGHSVGDTVLVEFVDLLVTHIRKSDQLFRFGGEEFVLLMPGVDERGLDVVMNNLQHSLRRSLKSPGGQAVTASLGIALLQDGESAASWMARADDALYRAKASGRDCIIYADLSAVASG